MSKNNKSLSDAFRGSSTDPRRNLEAVVALEGSIPVERQTLNQLAGKLIKQFSDTTLHDPENARPIEAQAGVVDKDNRLMDGVRVRLDPSDGVTGKGQGFIGTATIFENGKPVASEPVSANVRAASSFAPGVAP